MGRKIPARKHRTVKDPDKQRRARFALIKDKINNPPQKGKEDTQEIPKSVLKIMELKQRAKNFVPRPRQKKPRTDRGNLKAEFNLTAALGEKNANEPRRIPKIKKRKNESLGALANRVGQIAYEMAKEVKYENKVGVKVVRNSQGDIVELKSNAKVKKSKKPTLAAKRQEREEKKTAGQAEIKEFAKRERFEFGDIVHRPPDKLTLPGRKGVEELGRKPGKSDLLLKQVLNGEESTTERKKRSLEKQRTEMRRQAAVDAFRELKKSRRS